MRRTPAGRGLLEAGRPVFGMFVVGVDSPCLATIVAAGGLDFLVVDLEHSPLAPPQVERLLHAARAEDVVALVRVGTCDRDSVSRAMDLGADGVIAARVESGHEAGELVRFARYAPEGDRGVTFVGPHDGFRSGDWLEKTRAANAGALCVALVESVAGLEAIGDICATPGLDAVWVGWADLAQSLGCAGRPADPVCVAAETRIREVCEAAGVALGIVPRGSEEAVRRIGEGYRLLALGTEATLLQAAVRDALGEIAVGLEQARA